MANDHPCQRPQPILKRPAISLPYSHDRHTRRLSIDTNGGSDDDAPLSEDSTPPESESRRRDDKVESCASILLEIQILHGNSSSPASSFIDDPFGNTLDSISD